MGKCKEHPRYNVVSIRVSDEEKALLEEMTRRDRTSMAALLRQALTIYSSLDIDASRASSP